MNDPPRILVVDDNETAFGARPTGSWSRLSRAHPAWHERRSSGSYDNGRTVGIAASIRAKICRRQPWRYAKRGSTTPGKQWRPYSV